jgi:hypothetical protein
MMRSIHLVRRTGGGIMIRVNGAAFRPSACALLFLCATALAQQPDGVSFEADSVSFDLRRFTEIEFLGDPVTLEGTAGGEARKFRLTAGRIAYDGARQVLQASDGAVFASDGLEVRNCSWTYDLSDKSVHAVAETSSKCTATVVLNRTPEQ